MASPPERNGTEAATQSAVEIYREIIKENIEYDHLLHHSKIDPEELDGIVELLVETVCTARKTIRVAGDDYPAELVKAKLLKLNSGHIEFVMDCMRENTTKIRNIKKYLLEEWFKGVLIDGITSNLTGLFDTVNTKVGEIAADVGATPQGWNSGIFNMLRNLSETVIVPIAGAILALIMCYELIQLIAERNSMHDMDSWMLFRWVFKSAAAIILVSNTWNIVMGVFDLTQSVVNQSAGVIIGDP